MHSSFVRVVLLFVLWATLLFGPLSIFTTTARAQDLKLYVVGKAAKYEQKTAGAPVLVAAESGPWQPTMIALGFGLGEFSAVSITPPGKPAIVLARVDENWELPDEPRFESKAALDAFAPDSATPYQFSFSPTGGGGVISAPLLLNGGNFPPAPHVANFVAGQRIDANGAFTLSWDAFFGATAQDFVLLSIKSESGTVVETPPPPLAGALAAAATSYLVPPGSLQSGQRYRCELGFYKTSDLRTTDVPGADGRAFYSSRIEVDLFTTPVVTSQPENHVMRPGQRFVLEVTAEGTGTMSYQWRKNGANLPGESSGVLSISEIAPGDAGDYDAVITDSTGQATSRAATISVDASAESTLANLSNRSQVLTGNDIMIPGFVVTGIGSKRLLVRAVGPALADFGVGGFLVDPQIVLYLGDTPVTGAVNDNWNSAANAAEIRQASASFAFPLPEGGKDAAMVVDLSAGVYSVKTSGVGDGTGVALFELYDIAGPATARLANISNRGFVGTGDAIMIPGFVIQGSASKTVLIRVVGPTLGLLGVPGVLADPVLGVYRGADQIAGNDDWQTSPTGTLAVTVGAAVGAFDLAAGSKDAAIVRTLAPGAYTVQASGKDASTGTALIEVYAVE